MKELLQALNNYLQLIKPYFAAAAGIIYEAWKSSGIVGKFGFVVIGATVLFIFCKLLSLPFRKKSGKKKKSFSENVRAKPQSDTKTAAEPPAPKVKITSAYKIDWSKPPVSVRKINWDDGVNSVEKIDWSKVDRK